MKSMTVATQIFKRHISTDHESWRSYLSEQHVSQICQAEEHRWRKRFWSPWLTI